MRRIIWGVLAVVVIALLASLIWEPLAATSAAPPAPLKHDARIVRDEFGVPHIFGKTDADTAYGLAYAHAEDDFETIQDVLAMTRGRFGAMVGQDGAKVDYVLHLIKARETAAREYPKMPADVRAMLDGYARGLNLFAARHPEEVRLRKLFPVNGEDVATGFVLRSPFFFGLDKAIGKLVKDEEPLRGTVPAMTPVGRDPDINGSNAFAVAPRRMSDGKTWLISNAHQPYEGQVAFYEAVVHSGEGLDLAGVLFPGMPFIAFGHNRTLGWTNTVNGPDLIDVYKLVLNESGDKYRLDGKWLPLETKRVWLPVKFGPFAVPVPRTVYHAPTHGPVVVNKSGAFAIRYAGIGQMRMMEQFYRLGKAQDWAQWSDAMAIGGIASFNFVYADRSGRIAYVYNGLFPPRRPGFDYTGVVPGDVSANIWQGAVGFDRMPKIVDPPSGFVVNANNNPFVAAGPGSELDPKDFSPLLGIERRTTNRIVRAMELLNAEEGRITPERLLAIKFDTGYSRSSFAGPWIEKLLAADLKDESDLAKAQKLLATWDWNSDSNAPADALGEAMMHMANRAAYNGDPLPDAREKLREVVDALMKGFGRIDPPLADVQRMIRGKVDLPANGGTDTLRAATTWDPQPDGKMRVKHGDSFIMLVNWDRAGKVWSQSIQPYGAATNRPNSPHYTDQMKLFVEHRFKPVHFERADLLAHAMRAYRP